MLRKLIPQSRYARNVITLMTGTGLAQAIPVAISPILTRLYSPADFGTLALYTAIVSIASVLVTGRYELAIMLPKNDRDAMHIVVLAAGLSCVISGVLLVVVVLFNHQITQLLGAPDLAGWLYWGPVSTLLMGIYTSLNYWSNRKGHYRRLAINRVVQAGSVSITQLVSGYIKTGALGLLAGQLIGQILSTVALARFIIIEDGFLFKKIERKRAFALSTRYINFPKYMIAGQLMNTTSGYLPIFLLSILFGPAVAGLYSLSQRVLVAPTSLIGGAVGDVYRNEAARIYRNTGNCLALFKKALLRLAAASFFLCAPIFFFGEDIFGFVFGERWRSAGDIASTLSVMVFFQMISSPLSQTVLFANMQKLDMAWQFLRLFMAAGSLYVGYTIFGGYKIAIFMFAASFSFLYILHTVFQYSVARGWR